MAFWNKELKDKIEQLESTIEFRDKINNIFDCQIIPKLNKKYNTLIVSPNVMASLYASTKYKEMKFHLNITNNNIFSGKFGKQEYMSFIRSDNNFAIQVLVNSDIEGWYLTKKE